MKAITKLGDLEPVSETARLFNASDMQAVIDAITAEERPASRDEVTSIVALLLASYPHARGQIAENLWKQSVLKLHEVFSLFPAAIGFAAVDVTGLPSQHDFLPKVYHINAWCEARKQRMYNARAMAMRHIAEGKRRAEEKAERQRVPEKSVEERRAFVARVMANARLQSMGAA